MHLTESADKVPQQNAALPIVPQKKITSTRARLMAFHLLREIWELILFIVSQPRTRQISISFQDIPIMATLDGTFFLQAQSRLHA